MTITTPRALAAVALAALVVAAAEAASATADGVATGDRIAVVTLEGGRATAYSGTPTSLPGRHTLRADRAALSPDGRLVAYTRLVGGRAEVRVAQVTDGGSDRLIARVRPDDVSLAFSPDGRRVAYTSADGITTVGVTGTGSRRVSLPAAWRGSRFSHVGYTPDGRGLLASRTTGDGRAGTLRNELDAIQLTTGRGSTLFRSADAYDQQARPASFSPDGSIVAVDGTGGIVIVPTVPGDELQLTTPPRNGSDFSPLISPDGTQVAFARTPYRGVADVYVIGTDGTGLRRVTTTPIPDRGTAKVGSTPLAWSPDGRSLLTFRHDRFAIVDVGTRASTDLRTVGIRYAIAAARWSGSP